MFAVFSLALILATGTQEDCSSSARDVTSRHEICCPTIFAHISDFVCFDISNLKPLDLECLEIEEDNREDREQDAAGNYIANSRHTCFVIKRSSYQMQHSFTTIRLVGSTLLRC